jgi:hypothetical protein
MTIFSYLNENIGSIHNLVKIGLVNCSIINHYSLYSRYDYYRKAGNKCRESVLFTARDHKVSERTVFRIRSKMETEI